jgi:hypothetical protein
MENVRLKVLKKPGEGEGIFLAVRCFPKGDRSTDKRVAELFRLLMPTSTCFSSIAEKLCGVHEFPGECEEILIKAR